MRTAFFSGVIVILLASGTYFYTVRLTAEPTANYRTATVARGDMLATISATGTLEPEDVVDVGAQITGLIKEFGADPQDPSKRVDFCSSVQEGTVLARIDDSLYRASVAQAEASLQRSQADLEQLKAKLMQSENDWKRAKSLIATHAIADTDYDAAVANYEVAKANVNVGKAQIEQDRAALNLAKTNLSYTVVRSPVKGTIIARRVNVGQTVVSNLSASSLFLLGKDLRRIQVWASVNEADIGRIRTGQKVHFSVDAFPNETFYGKVLQIRLNATMTQNVVTYTVVVDTDNSNLKLLPYQTANVQFEVAEHLGVMLVPNAALRWKPRSEQLPPDIRESQRSAAGEVVKDPGKAAVALLAEGPKPPHGAAAPDKKKLPGLVGPTKSKSHDERGRIWAKDGNYVRPVDVKIIATDGTSTEIRGEGVKEELEVVIGENVANDQNDTTNPFVPKLLRGSGTKSRP